MTAGYLLDAIGLRLSPVLLGLAALAAAALGAFAMRERVGAAARIGLTATVAGTWAYALWIASPSLLPVTNGPDVVHHLQLIHFIARTGRLPHDPALAASLVEMMNYTPGAHILAAAGGAWLRLDPLRLVYPLAALFVAIKAGILYEIARRLLPVSARGAVQALAAPLLAFVPVYFLGSFVQFFFLSQVVSETFAMAMVLASVAWVQSGRTRSLGFAAICGVAVGLTWPVWIGVGVATLLAALVSVPSSWRDRLARAGAVSAPIALTLLLHRWLHPGAEAIVTSGGAVTAPSTAVFGIWFLLLAGAGVAIARRDRAGGLVLVCLGTTILQAAVLAVLVSRAGSTSFYMPFKMMYLAILPAAVLGAVALARNADFILARAPRLAPVAACLPVLVAVVLLRGRVPLRRVHGSLSMPAREVALQARDHVPPACIDYFSTYWLTGYWLHLDVLDNPRISDRMREETFDFPDTAAKWIEGRGLPYAIVEDMNAIPREVRDDMDPILQRGSFVLVRNRRPAACTF